MNNSTFLQNFVPVRNRPSAGMEAGGCRCPLPSYYPATNPLRCRSACSKGQPNLTPSSLAGASDGTVVPGMLRSAGSPHFPGNSGQTL